MAVDGPLNHVTEPHVHDVARVRAVRGAAGGTSGAAPPFGAARPFSRFGDFRPALYCRVSADSATAGAPRDFVS